MDMSYTPSQFTPTLLTLRSAFSLFAFVFLGALILQFLLPWWIVVVIGFIAGLIGDMPPRKIFVAVFCGIGFLWLAASLYLTLAHSAVLLPRIAGLFGLPAGWMVFVVTVLAGALPSSLAAIGGTYLRAMLTRSVVGRSPSI